MNLHQIMFSKILLNGGTFCFNAALFNILEGQTDKEKLKQAISPLQKWFSKNNSWFISNAKVKSNQWSICLRYVMATFRTVGLCVITNASLS